MSVNKKTEANSSDKEQLVPKKIGSATEPALEVYSADHMRRVALKHQDDLTFEFIDDYIRDEAEEGKMSVIVEIDSLEPDVDDINERVCIENKLRELGYCIKVSCKENKTINKYKYTEICWGN